MWSRDAQNPKTVFYLMRHAPTEWNAAGRIQGQADSPLTATGRQWADGWGVQLASFALQRVLTSDTGRAVATARHINQSLHLPVERDARLREQDWGAWTGHRMADLRLRHQALFRKEEARGWSFCPPGGETRLDVLERARAALLDAGHKWPRQRLLVISHEGVLKCLVYHLAILQSCGQPFVPMAPYSLHRLAMDGNSLTLEHMNALALEPRPKSNRRERK